MIFKDYGTTLFWRTCIWPNRRFLCILRENFVFEKKTKACWWKDRVHSHLECYKLGLRAQFVQSIHVVNIERYSFKKNATRSSLKFKSFKEIRNYATRSMNCSSSSLHISLFTRARGSICFTCNFHLYFHLDFCLDFHLDLHSYFYSNFQFFTFDPSFRFHLDFHLHFHVIVHLDFHFDPHFFGQLCIDSPYQWVQEAFSLQWKLSSLEAAWQVLPGPPVPEIM